MLYENKITVFNFDEENKIFLNTLITDVECQFALGIARLNEFNASNDRCLAMIKFEIVNGEKETPNGKKFKDQKEWDELNNKSNYFTFKTDKDFFAIGDFSNVTVSNLEIFKNQYTTKVFLINEYREYTSVLPHWELFGGWVNGRLFVNA